MVQIISLLLLIFIMLYISLNNYFLPPSLTTVKKKERNLLTDSEKKIYDDLMKNGFYVSCRVTCGFKTIPMALIPFRVAIVKRKRNKVRYIIDRWYYHFIGWHVYFISTEDGIDKQELDQLKRVLSRTCKTFGTEELDRVQ